MPITKSTKKTLRQSLKRRVENIKKKRTMRALIKEVRFLVSQNKTKEAENLLSKIYKVLDKTAKTGIIKKNTASRKKSRITKSVNQLINSTKST
ncbi:MAG TPA: 30S ribosomal protein S20 [bacterium]|nr:30S ribosomal protein S20 [bacterium]